MTLVSVLMPMRNAEAFVRAALDSVLKQTLTELEGVAVNSGSTDGSVAVVKGLSDPRSRLVEGPPRGIAATLNAAIAAAQGDIVARCDADDLFPPERLERQVRWLTEHPEFGAI